PSDSDGTSGSDEDWLLTDTMSPLTEFLTFKQEVAGGAFSQTDKEYSHGKVAQPRTGMVAKAWSTP
ncbi:hypothetical protein chiPu_0024487, partial [Chiloscyllium punctatum]|nr:hypothetical protein [Chiloscyllium punctatum]